MKDEKNINNKPTIILNGIQKEQIFQIIKLIKSQNNLPEIVFATTTDMNKDWKIEDLIFEVNKEHQHMKKLNENKK